MSQATRIALTEQLMGDFLKEKEEIDRVDKWYRGDNEKPNLPAQSTREYRELQARSATPWLGLVVTAVAQNMFVEGYRAADSDTDLAGWDAWQANGLDARQIAVHRGALAHGLSYVTILRGDPVPVIRGASARRMMAFYQDETADDWPMYAIRVRSQGRRWLVDLYDDEAVYHMSTSESGKDVEYISFEEHGVGVCPVVRFTNLIDLDGRTTGEVAPFIPLAARIDQDTFDRLVVQRFGAWVVRTIAGMEKPDTTDTNSVSGDDLRAEKLRLRMEDILISESPDTKFGTLPGTPLDGYIKARDADIRDLAAVTQTPPDQLLGQMVNLSAEALAAAKSSLMAKVDERKHLFGESWEQVLRLSAFLMGSEDASNFDAEVRWKDTETRSLAQTADALGKLAQMLNVPVQALWERVPGVSKQEVAQWREMFEEGDPFALLSAQLGEGIE